MTTIMHREHAKIGKMAVAVRFYRFSVAKYKSEEFAVRHQRFTAVNSDTPQGPRRGRPDQVRLQSAHKNKRLDFTEGIRHVHVDHYGNSRRS